MSGLFYARRHEHGDGKMKKLDITIRQGSTFTLPIMWERDRLIYNPITAIANTAPVLITSAGHGIPDGWPVAVVCAKGLTELNATDNPPREADFRPAAVVSDSQIEFNKVSSACFKPYTSGGFLAYYQPADLAAIADVRMQIKTKIGGDVLHSMTLAAGDFTLDMLRKRIAGVIDATTTAAFVFKKGVYDIEVEDVDGVVTPLIYGSVSLTLETTTI